MKYKLNSQVTVLKMEDVFQSKKDKYVGKIGKITKIDEKNEPWIYKVDFINENIQSEWFSEEEVKNG